MTTSVWCYWEIPADSIIVALFLPKSSLEGKRDHDVLAGQKRMVEVYI
jgi:hypothetical protein